MSTESRIDALATDADLPEKLAAALRAIDEGGWGGAASPGGREPRRAWGARMSPELSYGRHAGPATHTARRASVVLLLFRRAGRWHLPLTERPSTLARHAGQISLPGGAVDAGETSSQAAIRELREELGVEAPVDILGRLGDCYVFASDFLVTPWVAATNTEPDWRPHQREVQTVVELPINVLFDESAVGSLTIERGPLVFHAPSIRVGPVRVWGATSVILCDLADLLAYLMETSL